MLRVAITGLKLEYCSKISPAQAQKLQAEA
jgi:hypothetical protein